MDDPVLFIGFDCPIHGLEYTAFCFRAFDPKNINRWAKFEARKIDWLEGELNKFLEVFHIQPEINSQISLWSGVVTNG